MTAGKEAPALEVPFVEPALSHLIDHLFDVGPSVAGEVLTFQEIDAWVRLTGHRITGWEASTLRQLSGAYLAEHDAASDPNRAPPFTAVPAERRSGLDATILAMMAQFGVAEGSDPMPDPDGEVREAPRRSTPARAGRASKPRR